MSATLNPRAINHDRMTRTLIGKVGHCETLPKSALRGMFVRPGKFAWSQGASGLSRRGSLTAAESVRCEGGSRMAIEVQTRSLQGQPTAVGSADSFTLVVDRPADAGGGGLGFNGGQLLYLAVAGCISNDLFREAQAAGINVHRVQVTVRGDFAGDPAVSTDVSYDVYVEGDAPVQRLRALVDHVDAIAEIPNSLRRGTAVRLHLTDAITTDGVDEDD
jgi:organic hydroperoxide reductase OsmC/OhrA